MVVSGIRILLVDDDDDVRGVLTETLARAGHVVTAVASADEACAVLADDPDGHPIVLTDIVMPRRTGIDLLREIRASHPGIAVVMMSGAAEMDTVVEAMRMGASDFVAKPVHPVGLALALGRAMERRRLLLENDDYRRNLEAKVKMQTAALQSTLDALEAATAAKERAWESALQALVDALDAREQETERHSLRVMRFTEMVARAYGVPETQLGDIARGALLHDIGKIGIPDAILLKPGGLSEAEWVVMKSHAEIGWHILKGIDYLAGAAELVYAHQERWDGMGYPRGLKGEEIPLGARLFAIVDAFDAIVSDRPYRKGRPVEWAREEIRRCAGTQFDAHAVEVFLSIPTEKWTETRRALEQEEQSRAERRAERVLAATPLPDKIARPN